MALNINPKYSKIKPHEKDKSNDIFVTKYEEKIERKNNQTIITRKAVKTNLTKKINETAKLVKEEQTISNLSKLEELERAVKEEIKNQKGE